MKTCSKCKIERTNDSFSVEKRNTDGLLGHCKACEAARCRARYAANRDVISARNRAWVDAHREQTQARHAKYRSENVERVASSKARYRNSHREQINAVGRARYLENVAAEKKRQAVYRAGNRQKCKAAIEKWNTKNRDRVRVRKAEYYKLHPEVYLVYVHNRRARKREVGGKLSVGLSERLYKLQRGTCPCCRQPLGDDFHRDHIMPLALGGPNTDDNMQLLCATCNLQKGAKHPVDFMQQRGFLL